MGEGQTPRDTTETVGRQLPRPPLPSTSPNSRARRRGGGSHPQTRPARVAGLFFFHDSQTPPCLWPVTGLAQGLGSFHSRAPRRPVMADEGADRSRKGGGAGHSDISFVCDGSSRFCFPFLSRFRHGGSSRRHLRGHLVCGDPRGGRGGSGGEAKRVRLAEGYSGRVRLAISKSRPFFLRAAG